MIQRLLYTALTQGLVAIKKDPSILADLFKSNFQLSDKEVEGIQKLFADSPPTVVHGYARSDQDTPIISILLHSEREADLMLHDDAGDVTETMDSDFGASQYSALWEHVYNIVCITEHPDVCQYIYEVCKYIILQAKCTWIPYGVYEIRVSGADLAPDRRYMPEHFFIRQLTLSCRAELLTTAKNSKFGKAFKLGSISVDKNAIPSDSDAWVKLDTEIEDG